MTYCTSGNIQLYETDVIGEEANVDPTPVRPAVLWDEFVHPDDEECFGGVVVQRETSPALPLVVFVCPYQRVEGHIVIVVIAEVLGIVPLVVFIFTSEVKSLAFHTSNSGGFDTDQSCQSEKVVLVELLCNHMF